MEKELETALKQLPELVKQREESLEKREKALLRLKASLEEEHPNLGQPDDVLHLNVGGSHISVLRRTLTQVEGSMLASRFSGRWDDSVQKDEEGRFFIDQPIVLFLLMINHLRAMASATPLSGPPEPPAFTNDPHGQKEFFRMVEYYGMTPGLYPIGIYRLDSAGGTTLVSTHPDYEVENDEFATYCLLPLQNLESQDLHTRAIKSFEIVVGCHNTAQVGWTGWNYRASFLFSRTQDGGQGAGYGSYSVAFDVVRCGIVSQQQYTAVSNNVAREGTVIRCENQGKAWYVDGNLVASTVASGDNVTVFSELGMSQPVPCISVKGKFEITAIEFAF